VKKTEKLEKKNLTKSILKVLSQEKQKPVVFFQSMVIFQTLILNCVYKQLGLQKDELIFVEYECFNIHKDDSISEEIKVWVLNNFMDRFLSSIRFMRRRNIKFAIRFFQFKKNL
jgi:hypothetical protein